MLEIELKSRVRALAPIRRRVLGLGGKRIGTQVEQDMYFFHPCRDFGATDEALRVRRAGNAAFITYKGPRQPGIAKTRAEIQVGVASAAQAAAILRRLGFRVFGRVRKRRESYSLDNATVCLDRVDGLGAFVEIERLGNDRAAAERRLLALGRKLSLSDFIRDSYLGMLRSRRKRPARR